MNHSFFKLNRAALFREWKISRSWVLGIGILAIISPIVLFISSLRHIHQGDSGWVFWNAVIPSVYGLHISFPQPWPTPEAFHTYSDPTVSASWCLIAAILGAISWATDRSSGGLDAVLMSPISRQDIVRTKLQFVVSVVLGIQVLRGVMTSILNFSIGAPILWHLVIGWWITNTLCMMVALTTSLLISSLVTAWLPAVVIGYVVLCLPFALGSFLDRVSSYLASGPIFGETTSGPFLSTPPKPDPFMWLKALSPIRLSGISTGTSNSGGTSQIVFDSGTHYMFMAGWVWLFFVLWIVLAAVLTVRLFSQTPAEDMNRLFVHPLVWRLLLGLLGTFIGFLIAVSPMVGAACGFRLLITVVLSGLVISAMGSLVVRLIQIRAQ